MTEPSAKEEQNEHPNDQWKTKVMGNTEIKYRYKVVLPAWLDPDHKSGWYQTLVATLSGFSIGFFLGVVACVNHWFG